MLIRTNKFQYESLVWQISERHKNITTELCFFLIKTYNRDLTRSDVKEYLKICNSFVIICRNYLSVLYHSQTV